MNIYDLIYNGQLLVDGYIVKPKNNIVIMIFKTNNFKLIRHIMPIQEYKRLRNSGIL